MEAEPIKPEEFRAMATSLVKVEAAAKQIMSSGLTMTALVILLHHRSRIAQRDIITILQDLARIGEIYLTPEYRKQIKEKK